MFARARCYRQTGIWIQMRALEIASPFRPYFRTGLSTAYWPDSVQTGFAGRARGEGNGSRLYVGNLAWTVTTRICSTFFQKQERWTARKSSSTARLIAREVSVRRDGDR